MPKRVTPIQKPTTRRPTFIKAWRVYRRMTQEGLAELVGTTPATISRIERGVLPYTQDTLELLANELSCEPADLLMRDPNSPIWSIYDTLKALAPEEQQQVAQIVETFKRRHAA